MKKILLMGAIGLSVFVFGQNQDSLKAFPGMLKPEFNVIEFKGVKSSELYNKIYKWINLKYVNPDFVIKSKVEDQLLRVNSIWEIPSKGHFGKTVLKLEYTVQFDIKDEKIRYSIFALKGLDNFSYSLCFKNNGERRDTKEVDRYLHDIEMTAENYISEIKNYIEKKEDW